MWWSGLRWVEAAHMQVWRFEAAFGEEMHALADAETRHHHHQDPERPREW